MKTQSIFASLLLAAMTYSASSLAGDFGKPVTWDRHSLIIDGRRVVPVMGEVHYSRIPAGEWQREVQKMKEGGVTIIATYVFWNHIEEQEGIFRWDGQRDLRRFLEICKQEEMPVVLRIGPFCHGEVRNGGIPDWMFQKGCRLRSQDRVFLGYAEKLYRQIYSQIQGLQWKDGGPLIACQFDNEYRGSGDYLMALKRIALQTGFDLPFYTRTGWPELTKPVPFGEMLPLYGDYADGFWDKETTETCGNYYKAFNFKESPLPASPLGEEAAVAGLVSDGSISTDSSLGGNRIGLSKQEGNNSSPKGEAGWGLYPYFTCELGGGMATAYHRRPFIYPEDCYSMALVKLGSGSNLLGYYMYHGGTNPESSTGITLNETQRTLGTANNDLPVKTYDFQCPLGEFGQTYQQYYTLRPLHLFMHDWAEQLAPMEAQFPAKAPLSSPEGETIVKGDDSFLRWSVRTNEAPSGAVGGAKASAFIFVNNYERLQNLSAKKNVQLSAGGVALPRLTIPAGCMAIFPVNIDGIRYATAQLVAKRDGKVYMMQVKGIPTTIALQSGKTLKNLKPKGTATPVYDNLYLLTQQEAERLFLGNSDKIEDGKLKIENSVGMDAANNLQSSIFNLQYTKVREAGPLRRIVKGKAKVAEAPSEEDWQQAAVYHITLPADSSIYAHPQGGESEAAKLLRITYQGDCARLYGVMYADGPHPKRGQRVLLADNFQYGRPFLYGLWRLPQGVKTLELRILPMQADAPVYLPREADKTPGERVKQVSLTALR